ncbi:MAG: potassium transporter TrkG [Nitrososphaerales archaeon]
MRRETKGSLNLLGFVLQINGFLTLIPIIVAFIFNEIDALPPFLFMGFTFLALGSFLIPIYKEFEIDFISACFAIFLTYLSLSLIGSFPYLWYKDIIFPKLSLIDKLVNSLFESVSGYTTTGLTYINDYTQLPRSLIFFRSLTQWLGGINIVFLTLMLFMSPRGEGIRSLADILGFERITLSLKGLFKEVIKIYFTYTLIFFILLTFLGNIPLFESINITLAGISTGGFLPINRLDSLLNPFSYWIITATMMVGSLNFTLTSKIFGRRVGIVYLSEFYFWLIILGITSIIFLATSEAFPDKWFHLVSAATTGGFQYINIGELKDSHKSILIFLMFMGGSAFSTAGGIKILRIIIALGALKWFFEKLLLPERVITHLRIKERIIGEREVIQVFFLIIVGMLSLLIGTLIFTLYGYNLIDSLFELTSAFATTGLSSGISFMELPIPLRLILIFEMIFGRVEMIPLLIFFFLIFGLKK